MDRELEIGKLLNEYVDREEHVNAGIEGDNR